MLCEGYCPNGCVCNHTSLSVQCRHTALDMVPITLNPHIRRLDLHMSRIKTLDDGLQFYESLETLDMSNNDVITIQDGAFKSQVSIYSIFRILFCKCDWEYGIRILRQSGKKLLWEAERRLVEVDHFSR